MRWVLLLIKVNFLRHSKATEMRKGIRQNPADSLSWQYGDESLENKMARIRRTDHRIGKRELQWSAQGCPCMLSRALIGSCMWGNHSRPGKNHSRGLEGKVSRTDTGQRIVPEPPPPNPQLDCVLGRIFRVNTASGLTQQSLKARLERIKLRGQNHSEVKKTRFTSHQKLPDMQES